MLSLKTRVTYFLFQNNWKKHKFTKFVEEKDVFNRKPKKLSKDL